MPKIRHMVMVTLAWSLVNGIRVSRDVRNGWLLANADEDIQL